jgi:hypothetical protein
MFAPPAPEKESADFRLKAWIVGIETAGSQVARTKMPVG